MKIIQVMPFFGLGGAEIMCENLVYELKKMGHDVVVLSLYDKETAITKRLTESNVDIRYLHKKNGFDLSLFKKMRMIFKEEMPDVVHTHLYTTKYVFPIAAMKKIKVVHTVHSVATKEVGRPSRIFNKFFFKFFGVIPVALSKNIKQTIIDEYKLREDKIPTVLNGIDLSKCQIKQDYNFTQTFKIVHVGSFQEVKNHIGMIDAFEQFHQKHGNSELHLIGDGARRMLIEQIVREKNLSSCVLFHGFQSNVYEFLHDMDIFTLPSLYEGIPMSIAEAMGTGLPIVATKVGGVPDMLDESSALLVDVDVDQIAQAFEQYYLDEQLREKHGIAAKERAIQFSSEQMARGYEAVYNNNK